MTAKLFEPIRQQRQSESVFPLRENEPEYARLANVETAEQNRYGQHIALYDLVDDAVSLNINGVHETGFNPHRNKQHAFHFAADNCIGCHACESACSEKNDLPAHLSFRSVGYVEGGTYPNYTRMNISMACNHCDDPVCLKGCPTRAYTKHPEYGAVLQDPDICFGCGYCTWVCPYNAPQLDPVKGRVEKCNMCVDRLEVGLKPACVSACLGNALNFGVVENTPENRQQIDNRIPGFPDPEITHPNIRFQQTRSLPAELTRPDSMPLKYRRDGSSGYKPRVDLATNKEKHWNLGRLSSRENPLVAFTLMLQAAIGLFAVMLLNASPLTPAQAVPGESSTYLFGTVLCAALAGAGLLLSASHLGKPLRAYRGFNNLRHSPMAREGLGAALFTATAGLSFSLGWFVAGWIVQLLALGAALSGGFTLYYMVRCYLIKARPFWNHWQTTTAFVGASCYLGGLLFLCLGGYPSQSLVLPVLTLGLFLEATGLIFHARAMEKADDEGAVSHHVQRTTFAKVYYLRNILLGLSILGVLWMTLAGLGSTFAWMALGSCIVVQSIMGRALFYVLVVPTTMPGAFFWKNKAFEQHARDIGLANMPQAGVAKGH